MSRGDCVRLRSGRSPKRRSVLLVCRRPPTYCSIVLLICLETFLLFAVSNCAKTFYMHWNTTNSIFRIDNTDHIIDVNKGNLAFEYDQVHIICPVYEPGTFDNETEKYIIYNVSKAEYETCRITNANPRIIAVCDKPQKLMFFTITFRPFTPQPGGLEFLPGNDYYFISTSSKDDLHRRIGGRCSTNNMKVVFKVCCADKRTLTQTERNSTADRNSTIPFVTVDGSGVAINTGAEASPPLLPSINSSASNVVQSTMSWPTWRGHEETRNITTSPRPTINNSVNVNSNHSPSHKPTKKTNDYEKHPNEVVKNEELTYSSAACEYAWNGSTSLSCILSIVFIMVCQR
ncbi:ephrin-B3 [Phlebotomus argentipes]|uniref:ephrin-B3 n=1 Tax=Phlebotomus argentipes TaxID=94469 RepID=UPI002892982B|nr:ephrin-B3 [Phlebotomus argentipes]